MDCRGNRTPRRRFRRPRRHLRSPWNLPSHRNVLCQEFAVAVASFFGHGGQEAPPQDVES